MAFHWKPFYNGEKRGQHRIGFRGGGFGGGGQEGILPLTKIRREKLCFYPHLTRWAGNGDMERGAEKLL